MVIVGLTGSIGMGKSTAAKMLRQMGIPVYDADAAVHALQAPGGRALPPIEAAFPGVVKEGVLDRQALGARVFGNKDALRKLEAIVHPLVAARQRAFLKRAAQRGMPLVVLDIPLLFEGRGERRVDATLVVSAPAFLQRRRVLARPGMTAEKFTGILRQQVPDRTKRRLATFVIPTGLGLAPTRMALQRAVARLSQGPGRSWPPNPWREKFTAQLARARRA
ncbi:dephospho-CoA kinase [Enhydrobacter aerosaccus]|uniref:Dephospho-CoA kinase n=1 Tax=Enhydrobacter aerosaccus TaxID=225324 RepID=A0A1T4PS69_9HYPH|nr:dephospho-CoA kinase [Enhydrobacter aerosaccus]SJZ94484.1 dephospho-CoA kinase [Enhydrobacter aerosaccus]